MFTVRIPLLAPPSARISEGEATLIRGQTVCALKWDGYYHVLKASGFTSQDDASRFVSQAKAAVAWLLLQRGIAAEGNFVSQEIRYYPNPEEAGLNLSKSFGSISVGPVDAIIHGSEAAIYPSDKNVRVVTGFPCSVHTSIPIDLALSFLVDGASFPSSEALESDEKLGVALALYGSYFTEQSTKARFLTLIMALETLATATLKSEVALCVIGKWAAELEQLQADPHLSAEDRESLAALKREVLFRRENSIRSQVRKLVQSTLSESADVQTIAREAVRLYDLRSLLVHEGTLDPQVLAEASASARALVHQTLLARYLKVTGAYQQ